MTQYSVRWIKGKDHGVMHDPKNGRKLHNLSYKEANRWLSQLSQRACIAQYILVLGCRVIQKDPHDVSVINSQKSEINQLRMEKEKQRQIGEEVERLRLAASKPEERQQWIESTQFRTDVTFDTDENFITIFGEKKNIIPLDKS